MVLPYLPIPPMLGIALYLLGIAAFGLAGYLIPFIIASGKHFLTLHVTPSENRVEYIYGMVKGDLEPVPLKKLELEKLTGEKIEGKIYAYKLELESVPFISETNDYEAIIYSHEPLKISELTTVDKIPTDLDIHIQAHWGGLRAVTVGRIRTTREDRGLRGRLVKAFRKRPVLREHYIPILAVYVTRKTDVEVLKKVREAVELEEIGKEIVTVRGRAFYDHTRAIVYIDEEKERLYEENLSLKEKLDKLKSAMASKYDVTIYQPEFKKKSTVRRILEGKYSWIAFGLLLGAFVVLVLLKLLGG